MTNLQYITDSVGHKTAVILPIDEYEEMLEDLHLGEASRASKSELRRDFKELITEMRDHGEIDV